MTVYLIVVNCYKFMLLQQKVSVTMDTAFHFLLPSSSAPCWTPTSSWSSCPLMTTYPWKKWIRLSWFTPADQHPMWTVHMCSVTNSDPAWVDETHTSVLWVHQLELSGKVWVTCWAPTKVLDCRSLVLFLAIICWGRMYALNGSPYPIFSLQAHFLYLLRTLE